MLSGYAFSRAVRAHILNLLAFLDVLLKNSDWDSFADREYLCNLYNNTINNIDEINVDGNLKTFQNFLSHHLDKPQKRVELANYGCSTFIRYYS